MAGKVSVVVFDRMLVVRFEEMGNCSFEERFCSVDVIAWISCIERKL